MKKFFVISMVLMLLLTSCSRQEEIDFSIFIERLMSFNNEIIIEPDSVIKLENECICFFIDGSGCGYLLSAKIDEAGRIFKITLSSENADIKSFINIIKGINACYVYEDTSVVLKKLINNNKLSEGINYYDSDWYSYTTSLYNKFAQYSVLNKKLYDTEEIELTLKQNDKSYLN